VALTTPVANGGGERYDTGVPEYRAPGVYVEEIASGLRTIKGVSTSTAGFVGETERGPSQPTLVTSWTDFEQTFGGYLDRPPLNRTGQIFLPYAVRGFFDNGGRRLVVARAAGGDTEAALAALMAFPDISLVAAPDEAAVSGLRDAIVDACDGRKDRFAITAASAGIGDTAGLGAPRDSSYAAFYYPWIRVAAPHTRDGHRLVPPQGHLAGIYARVDIVHGVHRAPANEVVQGIVTQDPAGAVSPVEFTIGKREQDILSPRGVNVIRDFRTSGNGVRVWGARTMAAADAEWKYIPVRRLVIFIEQSIVRGLEWTVFEHNAEKTWIAVRSLIGNFLTTVWRTGALAGVKAEDAFFIKCDRTTMTQDDIDNGRLVCVVGVAPLTPAEFVVIRFRLKTLDAQS
jgi:uncharacterized protein